ncbi:MAG: M28 family peptidase [Clostridia bacterium]
MKKLLYILLSLVVLVPCCFSPKIYENTFAETKITTSAEETKVATILNEICANYPSRSAGTIREKKASEYIVSKLSAIKKADGSEAFEKFNQTGLQSFDYISAYNDASFSSQNVIFTKKSSTKDAKTLIIGTNYDNDIAKTFSDTANSIEGLNSSAGSVASIILLADSIKDKEFDYDIQFVFFGAGEDARAGSAFFCNGIDSAKQSKILAMINIGNITYGDSMYMYTFENKNKYMDYLENTMKNSASYEIKNINYFKTVTNGKNELNLSYKHVGIDNDNINFIKAGVVTLNLFRGSYSSSTALSSSEVGGKQNITGTINDSRQYISEATNGQYLNNIAIVTSSLEKFISTNGLSSALDGSFAVVPKAWSNSKIEAYMIVSIIAVVSLIVTFLYSMYLIPRAKKAIVSNKSMNDIAKIITDELEKMNKSEKLSSEDRGVIEEAIKKDIEKKTGDKQSEDNNE